MSELEEEVEMAVGDHVVSVQGHRAAVPRLALRGQLATGC